MKGTITALIGLRITRDPDTNTERKTGGYGFVRDEDGRDRFFQIRNVKSPSFEGLREGMRVEFDPVEAPLHPNRQTGRSNNGLKADHLRVIES